MRANVSSYTRHHPNVSMTKAKISGNYVNSFLAKTESVRLGFDEAIMLDPAGYVAECTGANLFVVKDDRIVTTPSAPILEGITRDTLVVLAKELGYDVVEQTIARDQLYMADEVFVCGTAAEVRRPPGDRLPDDRLGRRRPRHARAPEGVPRDRARRARALEGMVHARARRARRAALSRSGPARPRPAPLTRRARR